MDEISAQKAAGLLGVTVENLTKLELQGLLHQVTKKGEDRFYSSNEISRIKSMHNNTISEEAVQVGIQIQQEVIKSVSGLMKLRNRVLILGVLGFLIFLLLVIIVTASFYLFPEPTSNFFGYYYRFNTSDNLQTLSKTDGQDNILGAATDPGASLPETSVLADVLKPVAATSLVLIKAVDNQRYEQIAAELFLGAGQPGLSGSQGPSGSNGLDGLPGLAGVQGLAGTNGSNGSSGSNGTNGSNGTSGSITGLTVSQFNSADISQWTNNSGYIATEADTLASITARGNTTTANISTTGTGAVTSAGLLTASSGLDLGTTSGPTLNSLDEAMITVGNIASTATQNFSTLNITNGGSGFLDVELVRGFINFQGMNTLYDDFTSKSLDTDARWTSTSTGGGSSCSILAGGLNGILRMDSGGAANRGCELTTQAIDSLTDGYYQRGNNPILETKLKIDVVTNSRIFAGFTNTRVASSSETNPSTNHAYIAKRAADTTWQCVTDDGGAIETVTDTGVTIIANTFYRLRVELRNGTTAQTICTIDNGSTVVRTVVTATQPGQTTPMDVYIKLNQSDSVAKNVDIDYVRAWQDDPPIFTLTAEGNLNLVPKPLSTDNAPNEDFSNQTNSGEIEATDSAKQTSLAVDATNLFRSLAEFFGKVIFYADVTFLGRPVFNQDTAGHVFIKAGDQEAGVIFKNEYANNPVVNVSVNLAGDIKLEDLPDYAVYDINSHGFKLKLSHPSVFDLNFSWIALEVSGNSGLSRIAPDSQVSSPVSSVLPLTFGLSGQATESAKPTVVSTQIVEPEASSSAGQVP